MALLEERFSVRNELGFFVKWRLQPPFLYLGYTLLGFSACKKLSDYIFGEG